MCFQSPLHPPQVVQQMRVYSEKIDSTRNCFRFYEVEITSDLFEETALLVRWGRIGRRGRLRVAGSGPCDRVEALAQRVLALRERHGYVVRDIEAR